MKKLIKKISILMLFQASLASAQDIAYIYGDVAPDGTIPSGSAEPYDQMLLTDTGRTGISQFGEIVENAGYNIDQYYDRNTTLTANYLNQFDLIIFGLHQKIWSRSERDALHTWINNGGSILIYSDSASGGFFRTVGSDNDTGQTVTNNLIARYGIEVTVDQGDGRIANRNSDSNTPIVGNLILEGEGVSPIAVDPNSDAEILIPYTTNVVSGNASLNRTQNITISNPTYAALVNVPVGDGNVMALYDRQPIWNNGVGSNINQRDNATILLNMVNFLVADSDDGNSSSQVVTLVKSNATNYSLDGDRGASDGQNIYLWSTNRNNVNQQWTEVSRGNGYFSYIKLNSNHAIDGGSGGRNRQNVFLMTADEDEYDQHWRKIAKGNNTYQLQKRSSLNYSIDGNRGGARAQNVYLYRTLDNEQNQQWIIQER